MGLRSRVKRHVRKLNDILPRDGFLNVIEDAPNKKNQASRELLDAAAFIFFHILTNMKDLRSSIDAPLIDVNAT
jgi:hypothetical protein